MPPRPRSENDDLGDLQVNRRGTKSMAASRPTGGNRIDPSYDTALRILGRQSVEPLNVEQRTNAMTDSEAADLAGRLSHLLSTVDTHQAANVRPVNDDQNPERASAPLVRQFIAALERPQPDSSELKHILDEINHLPWWFWHQFQKVLSCPGVHAKLAGLVPDSDPLAKKPPEDPTIPAYQWLTSS